MDGDGTIEGWLWDFGDGSTSDVRNPAHTYQAPGAYSVRLTVRDNEGASDDVTHQVSVAAQPPANTQTVIISDQPDPSETGEIVSIQFTVSSASGTPSGTVIVRASDTEECTGELVAGSGSCDLILTAAGELTLAATYLGADAFASSSDTESHQVVEPQPTATTLQVTSDAPDPSEVGQDVTVTFTVTAEEGTPGGEVAVTSSNEADEPCTGTLADGEGSCTLTFNQEGHHTITAQYGGNVNHASSEDTEEHEVVSPQATRLSSSAPE
jgi:PKD repeat protein